MPLVKSCLLLLLLFLLYGPEIALFSITLYVKDSKDECLCNKGLPRGCVSTAPRREGTSSLVINLVPGLWARVPEFYAVGLRSSSHLNDSDTAWAEWVWEVGRLVSTSHMQNLSHDFLVLRAWKQISPMVKILQKARERQRMKWTLILLSVI